MRNRLGVVAWALVAACTLAGLPSAYALTVTRGPYLQMGTATTQVLRWRTDVATDSQVRLGTSPANLRLRGRRHRSDDGARDHA